jgi:hypothetical protein
VGFVFCQSQSRAPTLAGHEQVRRYLHHWATYRDRIIRSAMDHWLGACLRDAFRHWREVRRGLGAASGGGIRGAIVTEARVWLQQRR